MQRKWVLLSLLIAGTTLYSATRPLSYDVAWLLYLAGQLLHGGGTYSGYLEINPPLIIWLLVPVQLLREATGLGVAQATGALLALASWAAACATVRLFYGRVSAAFGRAALIGVALIALPGLHFGQREHVSVLLLLPLMAIEAQWATGYAKRDPWEALGVVVLGVVGVLIKPMFLLAWLGLAVVSWTHGRRRRWLAAPLGALLYAGAVVAFTPEYIGNVRALGESYWHYGRMAAIWPRAAGGVLLSVVLGGLYFALRSDAPARARFALLACMAVVGYTLAGIVQGKGWSYHFLPAPLLGAVCLCIVVEREVVVARTRGSATMVLSVCLALAAVAGLWSLRTRHPSVLDQRALTAIFTGNGAESAAILSVQIHDAFPAVTIFGLRWDAPTPHLWIAQAALQAPPERQDALQRVEARLLATSTEWLEERRPDVLGLETQEAFEQRSGVRGAGVGRMLCADGRFRRFAAEYQLIGSTSALRLYGREPDSGGEDGRPAPCSG